MPFFVHLGAFALMPKQINRIVVEFIPADEQRYDTAGDWYYYEDDTLVLKISRMSKGIYQQALAVHEFCEALLCNNAGISQEVVDHFDMVVAASDDPGMEPTAPYHVQHCWADVIERAFIAAAGESWAKYDAEVGRL